MRAKFRVDEKTETAHGFKLVEKVVPQTLDL